ncbi:hypothetical protein [Sphingobacterium kitahiroshimense]|uniref:hypothetical protein n=1 Tax=Sphingobacterium kitahiroshimense TaxID=470446 RepID=UPI003207FE9B
MMINLCENRVLNIYALYCHFRSYYFYYLILVCLPLLYNKITYNYTWTSLPVFSFKFGSLFMLTALVIVFVTAIGTLIQRKGTIQGNNYKIAWKSISARVLFYILPIGLGLCILIVFKYIWYDGEQMYAILWEHAKSRFLLFLVTMIAFTIWLDANPGRNLLILYFPHQFPVQVINEERVDCAGVVASSELMHPDTQIDNAVEKLSQVVEDKIISVLENRWHDSQVKGLFKDALSEFAADHQGPSTADEQLLHAIPFKRLFKEVLEEAENERDGLDNILLENLYASLYAKSPNRLKPFFNGLKTVILFHIFAIESHSNHAVVILTDGRRIDCPKIIGILKNLGLLK